MAINKQLLLQKRPVGLPEKDTWKLVETEIPTPKDGELLLQCEYISLDPAMRGWLNDAKSYIEPVQINAVMRAGGVSKVIASHNAAFNVGDYVYGQTGVQQYLVKCKYLVDTLGFDGAIDYKNDNVASKIKEHFPKGIDVYFDNVGGEILDLALTRLAMKARIVICGAISQYNNKTAIKGPSNYLGLLVSRATMRGMVVFDHAKDYQKAAMQMGQWMAQGKLKSKEDVYQGIENFYETFLRLFSGEKLGKLVLKVSED